MPKITRKEASWKPVKAVDLRRVGSEFGTCCRCGKQGLRYVHIVENKAGDCLEVGRECAIRLYSGYGAEQAQRRLRRLWGRRSRWPNRKWKKNARGNYVLSFPHENQKVRVTVFPDQFQGGWRFCIALGGDSPSFSKQQFNSIEDAKLGAFDECVEVFGWDAEPAAAKRFP